MDIEKLKEKAEDVQTEEITDEQKQILSQMFIKNNHYTLVSIHSYMKRKGIDIEQVRKEIEDKVCGLTKSQRDFVFAFKSEFIQECFSKMYNKRQL